MVALNSRPTDPCVVAIYQLISDGEWHDQREVFDKLKLHIPPAVALREHERTHRKDVRQRIREGTHKIKADAVMRVEMGRWRYYRRAVTRLAKVGRCEQSSDFGKVRLTERGQEVLHFLH